MVKSPESPRSNGWRTSWRQLSIGRAMGRSGANLSTVQRNAVSAGIALRVWAALAGFGTTLILTNLLGVAAFGAYSFALGWINMLLLVTSFGFHHFNVREIARLRVIDRPHEMMGLVVVSFAIALIASGTVMFAARWIATVAPLSPDPMLEDAFVFGAFLLPLLTVNSVRQGILRGLGRPVIGQLPELGVFPAVLLALACGAVLAGFILSAKTALFLNIAAAAVAFVLGTVALIRELWRAGRVRGINLLPGLWFRGAGYSMIIGAAAVINSSADLAMLGAMTDAEQTGAYGLAARLAAFLLIPMLAVAGGLSHEVSALYNSRRTEELEILARASGRAVVVMTVLIAIAITAITPLIGWLFGQEFVVSAVPLLILVWSRVAETFAGQPGMVLVNARDAGLGAVCVCLSAILNVCLNLWLIPKFGMTGAAVATGVTQLLLAVVMMYFVRRRLGISTAPFGPRRS